MFWRLLDLTLFIFLVNVTVPTQELLSTVAMSVRSSEWKWLGRALGLTEPNLEQIEHKEKDLAEICYQMLLKWQRVNGFRATSQVLKKGLSSVKRDDLTEMIEDARHLPKWRS